ncbi:hypothetical protein AK812_SmicGene16580 [Symbiodinium microadriaticum]|uniref:Uncharacterized protein n=1 Tax=Symbiodinium microadriaticum TaxID=2951 RepID=A0A1Q9DZV8_SYMMI|nr:hypothetical protein AK812_SmicGene16580 [Symbiodinium microadriaticum]
MDHFALAARVAMTVERSREVFMKRCRTGEDGRMSVEEPKALLRGLGAFKETMIHDTPSDLGAVSTPSRGLAL